MMPIAGQVEDLLLLRRADRRQAMLRILRTVAVSLASATDATLAVLGFGATSPAMRRLRKAGRGSQLFVSSLLKRTWDKKLYSIYKTSLSSLNTLRAIQTHLINNTLVYTP